MHSFVNTRKLIFRISRNKFLFFCTKFIILFFEDPARFRYNNDDNNDDGHNHYSCVELIIIFSLVQ